MALSKETLNNFLPNGFETEDKEGYKTNFSDDKIATGYEKDVADIVSGPNLNNFIDKTGKNFNILNDYVSYLNNMPVNKSLIIDSNNKINNTQIGLKVYSATETYLLNDLVSNISDEDGVKFYRSLQANNTGHALTEIDYWEEVNLGGSGYHPNIFDMQWSDHIINDIQWLRADTFSWQSGDVYVTAYNKLVEEYNASTSTEETEGDITFKRSANGFKIATSDYEAAILSKYTSDGIAWYYILDTTNQRFKLPRTKFGFEGLRTNVADDIAESLPNITGSYSGSTNAETSGTTQGCFTLGSSGYKNSSQTNKNGYLMNFNASNSSPAYQDNAPVQERATQMYLYFYVGEYSQTAIEQTAGLNAELFNNKLDISTYNANPRETAVYLKTTYVNGTSGYNIWSNGYCEQWGTSTAWEGDKRYSTVTFLKTFANTNYSVLCQGQWAGMDNGRSWWIYSKTASTVRFVSNLTSTPFYWIAVGYLAEGEY